MTTGTWRDGSRHGCYRMRPAHRGSGAGRAVRRLLRGFPRAAHRPGRLAARSRGPGHRHVPGKSRSTTSRVSRSSVAATWWRGWWSSVVPPRGRAAAAVAEACGCVPQVEPAGEELACGVMPSALDVELSKVIGLGWHELLADWWALLERVLLASVPLDRRRVDAGCGHQDEVNVADLAYSSRRRASRSAPGRRN